ncbi:hypothetical protein QUB56_04615 [Microcoleus sp. AR_TQ3_B6]
MADIYTAIAQSIITEIFYHFKSGFYELAEEPVLENGTASQLK